MVQVTNYCKKHGEFMDEICPACQSEEQNRTMDELRKKVAEKIFEEPERVKGGEED